MRRFDKKKNMQKANQLAEQRHLESNSLIKEDRWEDSFGVDPDAGHRDTYHDTDYIDMWDDPDVDNYAEEFKVYVKKDGKNIEWQKFNDEAAAQHEIERLSNIGVEAWY
jgi:hypothetical protein